MIQTRPLTHDEKKASEAAFRGLPFNPDWSQSAKSVYDGIVSAMEKSSFTPMIAAGDPPDVSNLGIQPIPVEPNTEVPTSEEDRSVEEIQPFEDSTRKQIRSRREAIESGFLIDVTPAAQSLGIDLTVGMTKPLWEHGIAAFPDLSDEEVSARIRGRVASCSASISGHENSNPYCRNTGPAFVSP